MTRKKTGILVAVATLCALAAAPVACGGGGYSDDNDGAVNTQTAGGTFPEGSGQRGDAADAPPTEAPPTEAPPTQAPAGEAPAAEEPQASEVNVTAADFSFEPAAVEVASGSEVTFNLQNDGSAPHTLTLYSDADFTTPIDGASTGNVSGGGSDSFTVTFDEAGGFFFRCEIHPGQMQGEITVS